MANGKLESGKCTYNALWTCNCKKVTVTFEVINHKTTRLSTIYINGNSANSSMVDTAKFCPFCGAPFPTTTEILVSEL